MNFFWSSFFTEHHQATASVSDGLDVESYFTNAPLEKTIENTYITCLATVKAYNFEGTN